MKKQVRIVVAALLFPLLAGALPTSTITTSQAKAEDDQDQSGFDYVHGRVLVQFRAQTLSLKEESALAEVGATDAGEISGTGVHILELPLGANEPAIAKALQSRAEVEFAELDRILLVQDLMPNDPYYGSNEWHLPRIAAPTAWSSSTGSSSVIIAICDTGVEGTHPDLASKMVPGWNFYDNNSNSSDVYGHGTAVAGAAAAASNNALGVASVAWGCMIMPLRVSAPDGSASYSAIANAITYAADHGARVANVSYIVSTSSTVSSAARYLQSKGGVLTASAGNYSTFDSTPDDPYMLVVSATDQNDLLASWSNTGNNVDLSSPGVNIGTTTSNGTYGFGSGTSFSAPVVAGVAALVLSANPSLTAIQVTNVLKQSADDLGSAGWDPSYGAGRINAARAVSLAGGSPPPSPDTTPPSVSISSPAAGATVSGTVTVQVAASDNIGVTSVSLSVDGTLLGADTASPYTFSWNTSTLANGTHALTATASDAAGNSSSSLTSVTVNNVSDSTPPAVSIASPASGSTVSGNVSVFVNATDNVAVMKVELYVDGRLASASTTSPFTNKWNSRKAASGQHTLQCKGYDAAGNVGVSATIAVYK